MTQVLITVDTELSSSRHALGMPLDKNLEQAIFGAVGGKNVGIAWQMEQMERRGITGVFFVDPMPGLVFGPECVERIVEPILRRNHEVQAHIHTEWLAWAKDSPVEGRQGHNIGDFTRADQIALIDWARGALMAAGARQPTAFRAGNFGANDATLDALNELGMGWDSSFNPAFGHQKCKIRSFDDLIDPAPIDDVIELPVAGIWDRPQHFRPAQVCSLSQREMRKALHHAAATRAPAFVVVTHSFEMLSRDRARANKSTMSRFEGLCDTIAAHSGLDGVGFAGLQPNRMVARPKPTRLAPNTLRTAQRLGQQAIATWRYERRLRPN